MSEFPEEQFSTSDQLLKRLQERSDDFEGVTIMVANDMPISGPDKQRKLAIDCCCMIKLCNGGSLLIHRDELETLLNDGILQRMKIPISLLPLEAR